MLKIKVVFTLTLILISGLALSADTVRVESAWARATVPGQNTAAIYMKLESSVDAELISASTSIAPSTMLHSMKIENGVMKMRHVERLSLPANKIVELKPGSYHLMLIGIKQQLREGERFPLVLKISQKNQIPVEIKTDVHVRALSGNAGHAH